MRGQPRLWLPVNGGHRKWAGGRFRRPSALKTASGSDILLNCRKNTKEGGERLILSIQESALTVLELFLIAALGYCVGAVKVRGISLGSSAIFLVALVFGHFGVSFPAALQTTGMVLFISSVGISAGPSFVGNLRRHGAAYILLCLFTAVSGSLVCVAVIRLAGVETPLAMGLMTGAYTTSPGFASAKEAFHGSAEAVAMVAAGYGIMYPVGTLCKVLFVQMVPRLLGADMEHERALVRRGAEPAEDGGHHRFRLDPLGFFTLAAAIACGILLGGITIPLPGIGSFSLGNSGGPLLVGLLLGHLGHIGPVDMRVEARIVEPVKELGLILFFTGAGTEGGAQLVEIVSQYGAFLLVYGIILVFVPLTLGFALSRRVFRLPMLNGLAAMSGGMTCSPSLAALIQTAGTTDVASTYATTYPIALINMVIVMQILANV